MAGKAGLIYAANYPKDPARLSFYDKLFQLQQLAELNLKTKTNCVHVSLNFDPSEKFSEQQLSQMATVYMQKIGFGDQPYLVYEHRDAGHPHIHIVTTNIRDDGSRISLHNIGRNQSEKARREIEETFGLVKAEGRGEETAVYLKPVTLEKVDYGKSATKKAIANTVREVVRMYKFTSLAELNAVLGLYNIVADRGAENTKMYEKGGLVYQVTDATGRKTGVPIKASSLSFKPTLKNLELLFDKNKAAKKTYRERIKNLIDKALNDPGVTSKQQLSTALEKENISIKFRENAEGRLYGITFIDHKTKTVFNGSDLGKAFTAAKVLARLGAEKLSDRSEQLQNEARVKRALQAQDFSKGINEVITGLYRQGIRITTNMEDVKQQFLLGHYNCSSENYMVADRSLSAYLQVNGITGQLTAALNEHATKPVFDHSTDFAMTSHEAEPAFDQPGFMQLLAALLAPAPNAPDPYNRRKRRKRRNNPFK